MKDRRARVHSSIYCHGTCVKSGGSCRYSSSGEDPQRCALIGRWSSDSTTASCPEKLKAKAEIAAFDQEGISEGQSTAAGRARQGSLGMRQRDQVNALEVQEAKNHFWRDGLLTPDSTVPDDSYRNDNQKRIRS